LLERQFTYSDLRTSSSTIATSFCTLLVHYSTLLELEGAHRRFCKMALTILMFYTRRPDFTPAQFREHMETKYLPIVKEVMGHHIPESITLRYVERCGSGFGDKLGATLTSKYRNDPDMPVLLVGYPKDLGWDAMVEMTFKDDLHLMQSYAATNSAEGQRIRDAEEEFTMPEAMKVVLIDRTFIMERNTV
jgi:hypothetical protein